ncbi:DUF1294 domain-containing protein [Listeria costaricensis]|uniref:DUF1294 domain-containing protein n=1 Tax=Listeria costaricensis TaxID=2026604 RepID=UPI000C07E999|nr:DUF1294 domain-containing protein [Listeria costaricensis]
MFILWFTCYLLVVSLISFSLFGIDKRRAIKHRYRIPESVLLLSAFCGGAFGGWLGMQVFHHKTRKMKFKILMPMAMLLVAIVLIFFLNK